MQAHARLVAALCRPGAVAPQVCGAGDPVPARIETHLATLLLWPERVLKLKKPRRLPFADFSTPALRHQDCQHELRLNRRTAPQHYLGVLPVTDGPDGPCVPAPQPSGPAGAVQDWAVWMRRFDPDAGFDRLASAGRLQPAHVDALAAAVATFHAGLQPLQSTPPDAGWAEATRHWPRDNLRELTELWPDRDHEGAAALARLERWTESRGAALADLIDRRAAQGRVREVHGDLHLGNVVWEAGAPLIFDALEFNAALRCIDTVGDWAFTFMDLHAHGLPRLAWRFASAVLEAEDDIAALPLLPWWAAYRAAVRAKVALMTDGGPTGQAAARRLIALALRLAGLGDAHAAHEPPHPPRLVLMMGLSGSGKSRVAAELAERLGGVRLRSDVERKRLFGLAPQARGGAALGLYSPEAGQRTYARLQRLADMALQAGVPAVVDAASLRRAERDALRGLAARGGWPFSLVWCDAPLPVLQGRLAARAQRGDDPSDAGPELLAQQAGWAEWPGPDEREALLRLDTAGAEDHPVLGWPAQLSREGWAEGRG